MIRRTRKYLGNSSWFVNVLLSLAFIAIPFSPCTCKAMETGAEQKSAHSCCQKNKTQQEASDKTRSEKGQCDNCSDCRMSAGCNLEKGLKQITFDISPLHLEQLLRPAYVQYDFFLRPIYMPLTKSEPPIAHAGFRVTSSSSISSLLHRWLV